MDIGDFVKFSDTFPPGTDSIYERQRAAVNGETGTVSAMETRDDVPYASVVFPVYGGEFTGIPAELLVSAPAPEVQDEG